MFCVKCGQSIASGTVFCPNCGQRQADTVQAPATQGPAYTAPPAPANFIPPQPQPYGNAPAVKPRKRHGCLTAFIIFIVVLLLAAAAAYFFLPGLFKPNDLGIKSTQQSYESAMAKLGVEKDKAPESGTSDSYTIKYGPPHDVAAGLTSEELTAFFNENRPPYYAVKNVQVRINDDGTVEAAGTLDTRYVFSQILGGQYTKQDAQKELPMLNFVPENVNVYFKISGSVDNNLTQGLKVETVKVAGITIPQSIINSNTSFITDTLNSYISRECARVGANIEHIGVSNGQLDFKGNLPSSVTRTPAQ